MSAEDRSSGPGLQSPVAQIAAELRRAGHDCRNQAASILAHAELLQDEILGPITASQRDSIDAILRSLARQERIASNISALTRELTQGELPC